MSATNCRGVVGIDVGTSGVRVLVSDRDGCVLGESHRRLPPGRSDGTVIHEQDPAHWWDELCAVTKDLLNQLRASLHVELSGVAVSSTSGSLVVADKGGRVLRPAIMYDDRRSVSSCPNRLSKPASPEDKKVPTASALHGAAWLKETEADNWERVDCVLSPSAWITGRLTGDFRVSDSSNALKFGYLPQLERWSDLAVAIISSEKLPAVVPSGRCVGAVSGEASVRTGLPAGTRVFAGATDGMAALLASGASRLGDANTTLGTTLVWKVLAEKGPTFLGAIYSHWHPLGLWAPGCASNTGPGSLQAGPESIGPQEFDRSAEPYLPSSVLCYMLRGRGERFPFSSEVAETFVEGVPRTDGDWRAAQLQSLAFVERWGYEILEDHGIGSGDCVFSTGAAARSSVLSALRATVLNREIAHCRCPTSTFGAAILAASNAEYGGDLRAAIRCMTRLTESFRPATELAGRYEELYGRFRDACSRRGYVSQGSC